MEGTCCLIWPPGKSLQIPDPATSVMQSPDPAHVIRPETRKRDTHALLRVHSDTGRWPASVLDLRAMHWTLPGKFQGKLNESWISGAYDLSEGRRNERVDRTTQVS